MNSYAIAGEVLDWIAEPYGDCSRTKLFRVLNEIRERFYLAYEKLPLFDIAMCFEVQTFCEDCNACQATYRGVTLPREFQNVEAMWFNDAPVQLFSSWREWQQGMAPEAACHLQKFDLPNAFASERDPLPMHPERLRVQAQAVADCGAEVVLRYVDFSGAHRMETLTLSINGALSEFPARALAYGAGFSKKRTKHCVVLSTESGRHLSVYAPDETLPAYRRIKVTGLPRECGRLNIRGSRKFFPIYSEEEVVESNNRIAFQEMARFVRVNEKPSKSADDVRTAGIHAQQAVAALVGEKARNLGKSTQGDLRIETASYGPPRLGGW